VDDYLVAVWVLHDCHPANRTFDTIVQDPHVRCFQALDRLGKILGVNRDARPRR
jgi:hypothetical protein